MKVTLNDIKPAIWRRVTIPSTVGWSRWPRCCWRRWTWATRLARLGFRPVTLRRGRGDRGHTRSDRIVARV